MIQTLPPLQAAKILCFHTNATSKVQIGRIQNIPSFQFERVIFPGQRLLFEALPDAQLEIYTTFQGKEILVQKISCNFLQVHEAVRDLGEKQN